MEDEKMGWFLGFMWIWLIAAWVTHIIVCVSDKEWGLLVAGALIFPVGWIHGTGVWLGAW